MPNRRKDGRNCTRSSIHGAQYAAVPLVCPYNSAFPLHRASARTSHFRTSTEAVFERYNITDDADLGDAGLKQKPMSQLLPSNPKITPFDQVG